MPFTSDMVNKEWLKQSTPDWMNTNLTATDRVAAYFELITGRRLTREEKIALPAIIAGDFEADERRRADYRVEQEFFFQG